MGIFDEGNFLGEIFREEFFGGFSTGGVFGRHFCGGEFSTEIMFCGVIIREGEDFGVGYV